MKKRIFVVVVLLVLGMTGAFSQDAKVNSDEFVRIPPKSPEKELTHLHIKPGFKLELVAAEPLVEDPVAMCFDELGRLFVAELHDHQHLPDPKNSKVKMLTDEDGDGRYDKAITLAEGMSWITAIAPWDGGVFVGASPDLIYLKDSNGDGKADVKDTILRGFDLNEKGEVVQSYHHERSLNNFNWGPGNRFYCAAGLNGGFVRNLIVPESQPMVLRKLDFSFDPRTREARPETGSSQHGMAMDDWGNRYQTTNSNPALFPAYDLRYRLRNPGAALPPAMASISRPDPKGPVFRRSRPEPWREARTRLRAAGLERGPVEQGGTVSGYFTGTADSAIYRGDLFPAKYRDSLFVGEVSENIVHRKEIIFPKDKAEPDAIRPAAEPDYEFIASSDNWFRPVQIINGPGGALYICDMYREVVEAWHTIPEYIREHLDRDSGKDMGRIWRVVPDGAGKISVPDFSGIESLVSHLRSPNAWARDTAGRLLYQHQDSEAIPLLEKMLAEKPALDPRSVLVVLNALDGLGALRAEHVLPFLESPEPWLRIHALRFVEKLRKVGDAVAVSTVAELVNDSDPRVLYQLAFTLGEFDGKAELFHLIAERYPNDDWLAKAVAASVGKSELPDLFGKLLAGGNRATAATLAVAREAGRLRISLPGGFPDFEKDPLMDSIRVLASYSEGLRVNKAKLSETINSEMLSLLRKKCRAVAADESSPDDLRAECLRFLPMTGIPEDELLSSVMPFLSPGVSKELQLSAVEVFRTGARSVEAGESLIDFLPKADAHLRPSLIYLLTRRSGWRNALLAAIEADRVKAMEIPASDAAFLRNDKDPVLAKKAAELLPAPADRKEVVAKYQRSLAMPGDPEKGEKIFRERCLVCHRLGEEGGQVGPAMVEFQKHGKGQILLNVLDPNKTVQPDYIGYLLTTKSEEVVLGRVLEDSASKVEMRDAAGNDRTVPRGEIKSLVSTGRSLMPEGMEAGLQEKDVADLLEFLVNGK